LLRASGLFSLTLFFVLYQELAPLPATVQTVQDEEIEAVILLLFLESQSAFGYEQILH
jgi:hypothetical protein